MPTWSEILNEIKVGLPQSGPKIFDIVRRKYLAQLHQHTGRNTVIYASGWIQKPRAPAEVLSMADEDVQGLMEVFHGLSSDNLDIILHSPGGSAEATEAMVSYIRSKFHDVRVIVPLLAMSAATMLACSGDRILMGKHSFLGPIDPQFVVRTPLGPTAVPAQAVLDQFELAKRDCQDPRLLGAWAPMLPQYGPALLIQCQEALKLSKELVTKWLDEYMFKLLADHVQKATGVAEALANHPAFMTHARPIDRSYARRLGLIIDDLETDQILQDLVLSVFHALTHTFQATNAVKIIENHEGRAFVRSIVVPPPQMTLPQLFPLAPPPGQPSPTPVPVPSPQAPPPAPQPTTP